MHNFHHPNSEALILERRFLQQFEARICIDEAGKQTCYNGHVAEDNKSQSEGDKLIRALPTDLNKYIEIWEEFYADLLGKMPQAQPPENSEEVKKKADGL
jgi:hypothetical protein